MSNMLALTLMFVCYVCGEESNYFSFVKTEYADMTATPGFLVSSRIECALFCVNVVNCTSVLYCDVADDKTCVVSPQSVSVNSMGQCELYSKEEPEVVVSNVIAPPTCENGGTLEENGDCTCPSYTLGDRCETRIRDCQDVFNLVSSSPGLYTVSPLDTVDPFDVQCDDQSHYGIVMMHRDIHSLGCTTLPVTYLDVGWERYKHSFSEGKCYFWLGLEQIHALTSSKPYLLHVYVKDPLSNDATATYSHFQVGDEASRYMMTAAGFSTSSSYIGDRFSLADPSKSINGTNFCTDGNCPSNPGCGQWQAGGWWYRDDVCYSHPHNQNGIEWNIGNGDLRTMKEMTMTLRPV